MRQLTPEQRSDAQVCLRRCVLFARLPEDQFDQILDHTRLVILQEGEVLFEQRQPAKDIFLQRSGQVKLALVSPEGHEKVIDLISPGGSFAEALMFAGAPIYPVSATALVSSSVWGVNAATYASILRQSTDACFGVMTQMSRRLHWQIAEIDRLTLHNAAFRLIAYLLDQVPSTDLGTSTIHLDTPKHVIASRLSITPETLSRTFAKLAKEGFLEIQDNAVDIHDIERLREYVRSGGVIA
ncbi:MAG: Crp/Fnr family transcriptional regulator [Pseudomonadota bacterium]